MKPPPSSTTETRATELLDDALSNHQAGDLQAAENGYRRALEISPSHPEALRLLGVLCYQANRLDEAVELLRRAIQSAPHHIDALCNLGMVLSAAGNQTAAEQALRQAIAMDPSMAAAYNALGSVLLASGDIKAAVATYQKALSLEPLFAEAMVNLANALLLAGRADLALEPCRRAIDVAGDLPEARVVMGNIQASLGDKASASASFRRACELAPERAESWCSLAASLESERHWDEALACFDRASVLDPQLGPAISGGLLLRKSLLQWRDLEVWSKRFAAGVEAGLEGLTPFIYLAEPSSPREQLQCARLWCEHIERRIAPARNRLALRHPRTRGDRITVGYFSYDFRRHPTAYTKVGLFENHDRSRFRILGYCNGPDDGSAIRRRVIDSFDHFTDVAGWPAAEVARRIHSDGVDILVDLKGHTLEAPTEVFAMRPAPIQVNYKGYPGTIGGGFIDYIVADEFVVPPGQQEAYSEQVVYLPETYWVDDSQRALPAPAPSRRDLGLPPEGTIFCGFNNSYKIGPAVFDDWAMILARVPGSVLWVQNSNPASSLADNLRREASLRHIAPDRLVFAPRRPLREYLALLTVADLFLDTRPYNGHTTASDALWAGLPVLTLPGETFASRVAGSLLRTLGLPELIAESREHYRETAVRLALDDEVRHQLRSRLQIAKVASPLYDTVRLTRHMEIAYLTMYEEFLAGRPPRGFSVPALDGAGSG